MGKGESLGKTGSRFVWNRDEDWRRGLKQDGEHAGKDGGTGGNERGKAMPSGFHHIALVCRDMKETIKFYEEGLGMKLRAVYPMHGLKGAKHCFLEAGNGCEISFVEFKDAVEGVPGVSFGLENNTPSPIGTHHHMAYRAENLHQLYRIREQLKNMRVRVSKVIDHGFIHSFYFEDPNGFHLEVTCTVQPYSNEEYQLEILDRPLRAEESEWDEPAAKDSARLYAQKRGILDAHGNFIAKSKL